jgi:hypothetical protein
MTTPATQTAAPDAATRARVERAISHIRTARRRADDEAYSVLTWEERFEIMDDLKGAIDELKPLLEG